jgi:hypothetical protein
MLQDQEISVSFSFFTTTTPTRTHFISGLNSELLKLPFFGIKMMVKSGIDFLL